MNKDEIFLIVFLYTLVVLIGSSKPFWNQLDSLKWVKALSAQIQEPLYPAAGDLIIVAKPVHAVKITAKRGHCSRETRILSQAEITTAKKISDKEEIYKG